MAADGRGSRVRRVADGPRRRAGQVRAAGSRRRRWASTSSRSTSSTCASAERAMRLNAGERRVDVLNQHLIDPEICIRCNTCEETCPVDAITHDCAQLRRRRRQLQRVPRVHRPVPDRCDRQLAHRRARRRAYARRAVRVGRAAGATARAPRDARHGVAPRDRCAPPRDRGRRRRASTAMRRARRSRRERRASAGQSLLDARAATRDGRRQFPRDRRRRAKATRATSCSTSAPRRSRCSKASRSASCRPAPMPTAARISRASIRWRARATASGPATTTCR